MLNPFRYYKMLKQQKANRLELAQYLEDHVTDENYCHRAYMMGTPNGLQGCALGYAAYSNIDGWYLVYEYRTNNYTPLHNKYEDDPTISFGKHIVEEVLHKILNLNRQGAIHALRNYRSPLYRTLFLEIEARFR